MTTRFEFAPHFSEEEFRCRCGCDILNVDRGFLERLERARNRAEVPFAVTSGCRCPEHNKNEDGEENSAHICTEDRKSYAADVWARGPRQKGIILPSLVAVGFNRFGIANSFLHVDIHPELPPNVIWLY